MSTNDKFIQSIVELLDKLIDHQNRSSNLLTEIKVSSTEVRSDVVEVLRNLREKVPDTISDSVQDLSRELEVLLNRIHDSNEKVVEQVERLEKDKDEFDKLALTQSLNIEEVKKTLINIAATVDQYRNAAAAEYVKSTKEREDLAEIIKEVHSFVTSLKSKKAWIGIITAGIIAIATFVSSMTNAFEHVKKYMGYDKPAVVQPQPQPQPPSTSTSTPPNTSLPPKP